MVLLLGIVTTTRWANGTAAATARRLARTAGLPGGPEPAQQPLWTSLERARGQA